MTVFADEVETSTEDPIRASWDASYEAIPTASCYAQISDEEIVVSSNERGFDIDTVASHPRKYFKKVGTNVQVPESVWGLYVNAMSAQGFTYDTLLNKTRTTFGKGTPLCVANGGIQFFAVDENDRIVGTPVAANADGTVPASLEAGRYFVAYVAKSEDDGFHMDGVIVTVEAKEEAIEEELDQDDTTSSEEPAGKEDETIQFEEKAEATVEEERKEIEEIAIPTTGSVEQVVAAEPAMEAAHADDFALANTGFPKTGDETNAVVYMGLMVIAACGVILTALIRVRKNLR